MSGCPKDIFFLLESSILSLLSVFQFVATNLTVLQEIILELYLTFKLFLFGVFFFCRMGVGTIIYWI